jgi:hypothetical protein
VVRPGHPCDRLGTLLCKLFGRRRDLWPALAAGTDTSALYAEALGAQDGHALLAALLPPAPAGPAFIRHAGAALGVPAAIASALAEAVGRVRLRRPPPDTSGEVADWLWDYQRVHGRL